MSTWTKTRPVVAPPCAAPPCAAPPCPALPRAALPRAGLSRWLLLLLAGLLIHCGDDPRPEEAGGMLHFVWAVGAGGAEDCERLTAVEFRATIFQRGQVVESYSAPCSDFELETGPLVPNVEYMTRATLVDELDLPKSPTLTSTRFDIAEEEVVDVTIVFDADGVISVGPAPAVPVPTNVTR